MLCPLFLIPWTEIRSFSPVSSPCCSLSRSLAPTLPENGCGPFLPAYRISDKVDFSATASPHISFHSRDHHGISNYCQYGICKCEVESISPTDSSMFQGMVVGWAILSPLAKFEGWAPGPVGDMSTGSRGWILWVSLAIMCSDSIVSLIPVVVDFIASTARDWTSPEVQGAADDVEVETPERLVPLRWVYWGFGTSVVLGTAVLWVIFGNEGIKPWASLLGYAIGGLLSILA